METRSGRESVVSMLEVGQYIRRRQKEIRDTNVLSREAPESGNNVVLFHLLSDQVGIKMVVYRFINDFFVV